MTLDGLIAFDQHLLVMLNGSDSMFWDHFILIFTNGLTWVPLLFTLFLLVMKNNETMVQIGLVVGCVLLGVFLSGGINGNQSFNGVVHFIRDANGIHIPGTTDRRVAVCIPLDCDRQIVGGFYGNKIRARK